jgi:hypothetical protein
VRRGLVSGERQAGRSEAWVMRNAVDDKGNVRFETCWL